MRGESLRGSDGTRKLLRMIVWASALSSSLHVGDTVAQALPQALINQVAVTQSTSLNYGYTSFYDAMGGTDPGLVYQGFLIHRDATAVKDGNGDDVALPAKPRVKLTALAHQFLYTTPYTVSGASLGFTTVVPMVYTQATSDPFPPPFPPGTALADNGAGLGDVIVGTFLQFKPRVAEDGRPVFAQRLELGVITPTGKYDATRDVQPGSNFWAINPYWALTWLPRPGWEISTRLQYVYNFKNTSPANVPPGVVSTQAGQTVLANFTMSYTVAPGVHVGLNGYYVRQLTASRVNGMKQDDTRTEKLGLGPGVFWDYSRKNKFVFNYYAETLVHNAPKFQTGVFRWLHFFE
jgi:hypothetical protein